MTTDTTNDAQEVADAEAVLLALGGIEWLECETLPGRVYYKGMVGGKDAYRVRRVLAGVYRNPARWHGSKCQFDTDTPEEPQVFEAFNDACSACERHHATGQWQ